MSKASSPSWKRCSSCKEDIPFQAGYYVCNVSTCNRKRTGLVFCSVSCWDTHLGFVRHRESWAVEKRAPSQAEWQREQAREREKSSPVASSTAAPKPGPASGSRAPRRILPSPAPSARASAGEGAGGPSSDLPADILIVASKLKKYVKARADMNTSDRVLEPLSDVVRRAVDRAIESARRDERKTILDRDFE